MLIDTVIQEFLADCKYRKLSKYTIKMYTYVLKYFFDFCVSVKQTDFSKIDSAFLKGYAIHLAENKGNSSGGVALQFRCIRALFGYANREDIENAQPFKKFRIPKIERPAMKYVEKEEYELLIHSARMSENPLRDTSIISVLFDTGVRIGELLSLTAQDILSERGMLRVRGKTGERLVPCSRPVLKRLGQYISSERPKSPLKEVFLTDSETAMNYSSVALMLKRVSKRASVPYKSPHCYRRGYCTAMVKNGADLFSIQRSMGHRSIHQTNLYCTLDDNALKQVHLVAAPTRR